MVIIYTDLLVPVPHCNLFLMNFKGWASLVTGVLASQAWRLCCHPPHCHGNYADDIVFLGWVWYMLFTHTQPLKEMSAGLYRRWWQTLWWIPPSGLKEINEFLKDTFFKRFLSLCSFLLFSHFLNICFCSYLFICCYPFPCSKTFAFCSCQCSFSLSSHFPDWVLLLGD